MYMGSSTASRASPMGRSRDRAALRVPRVPSNCLRHFAVSVRAQPTGSTTLTKRQSRSAGPAQSSVVPQPSPCPRQLWGGFAVCPCGLEVVCPGPCLPQWAQRKAPLPPPPPPLGPGAPGKHTTPLPALEQPAPSLPTPPAALYRWSSLPRTHTRMAASPSCVCPRGGQGLSAVRQALYPVRSGAPCARMWS